MNVVDDYIQEDSKKTVTEEKSDQKDVDFCIFDQNESNTVTTASKASISEQSQEPVLRAHPVIFSKENLSRDEGNESSETQSPAKNGVTKKKRRKRGNKKKKPNHPMSKEEEAERELLREEEVVRKHQELLLSGRPLAPMNTTQYIFSQYSPNTQLDVDTSQPSAHVEYHSSDSPIYNINPDYEDYHEKDFQQDYAEVHRRRLEEMTRAQLVEEHASLEKMHGQKDQELSDLRKKNEEDMKKLGPNVNKDNIEERLDQARQRYEELVRTKAMITGSNEDIVLPWEDKFHAPDDDHYNGSNLAD